MYVPMWGQRHRRDTIISQISQSYKMVYPKIYTSTTIIKPFFLTLITNTKLFT